MAQLVHARKPVPPRRRVEFGAPILLAVFAFFELLNGAWQIAVGLAIGAVALVPVAFVVAGRAQPAAHRRTQRPVRERLARVTTSAPCSG
ncbi:hypothetical protein [Kribbella shirazensis]|uniref:Uncharacterized protein n=1 Tax=Kribbella shirazensis TaxID=1105143 RepID=A0A7X5VAT8_9ACTN|nr:hypothetical protein [Kribbella shirazensis]NIK57804.1 hypothetical protein [Kribbella shirazensis]